MSDPDARDAGSHESLRDPDARSGVRAWLMPAVSIAVSLAGVGAASGEVAAPALAALGVLGIAAASGYLERRRQNLVVDDERDVAASIDDVESTMDRLHLATMHLEMNIGKDAPTVSDGLRRRFYWLRAIVGSVLLDALFVVLWVGAVVGIHSLAHRSGVHGTLLTVLGWVSFSGSAAVLLAFLVSDIVAVIRAITRRR